MDLKAAESTCLERDSLTTIYCREGSGFKTVLGDIMLPAGGKYFFLMRVVKGALIKIGITSRADPDLEKVRYQVVTINIGLQ